MKRILTPIFFIQALCSFGQTAFIKGKISDPKTKETIVGVNVILDDTTGTTSDIDGNYFVKTTIGKHKLEYKFVGYTSQIKNMEIKEGDTLSFAIALESQSQLLDVVVISAGKFEQNLNEVTVSMEVLKPQLIENKSLQSIENAVDQVPGVNVIDGQANIRGGSGFSYGAGSRVLLMVDEMPMLSADAGDVKWTFLPIENCEQIEVIKGASSALFGSSAMNGVINFRTAYAKEEPETKINIYSGIYDDFKRKELKWWKDANPAYSGINFYHGQKVQNLDIVVGGNLYSDEGYRYLETEQRYRANVNLRYRFQKKLEGLQIGVNANTISTKGGLFLIWVNPDSALFPAGGDLAHYRTYRTNVDPFLTFNSKHNSKHTLRTRFYRIRNTNDTDQESVGDVYYSEYQYQKRFENKLTWTAGLVYNYNEVHSGTLYGTHYSSNAAVFSQFDKKWDRLNISFGLRAEYFKTDSVELRENINLLLDDSKPLIKNSPIKPVSRAGINYRFFKGTFVRSSFGQGFRFPTIAERFIRTNASGLDIYPNDTLKPESGWSAEIGIKQVLKIGNWRGYLDVAGFITEYKDMMEFSFGQFGTPVPPLYGIGFQSQNIGNTRIKGVDISLLGEGKIGPVGISFLLAYTYIDPRQTDFDSVRDAGTGTTKNDLLKYRYVHSGKADLEINFWRLSTGINIRANSFMQNIDAFFGENEAYFPGMQKYRKDQENRGGDIICDYRLTYQLMKTAKITAIVNNMFNREVMGRPADMSPPRIYALQLTVKF